MRSLLFVIAIYFSCFLHVASEVHRHNSPYLNSSELLEYFSDIVEDSEVSQKDFSSGYNNKYLNLFERMIAEKRNSSLSMEIDKPTDLKWHDWPFVSESCVQKATGAERMKCENDAVASSLKYGDKDEVSFSSQKHIDYIKEQSMKISGVNYWIWSMALDPPVALAQYMAVAYLVSDRKRIQETASLSYVEIGSHKGTSFSYMIDTMKKINGDNGNSYYSLDPYFEAIQIDSQGVKSDLDMFSREEQLCKENVNKLCKNGDLSRENKACNLVQTETDGGLFMVAALALYELIGQQNNVVNIRKKSKAGLEYIRHLILRGVMGPVDMVYIDGEHSRMLPLIDTVFSLSIIRPGGVLILDDWTDHPSLSLKLQMDKLYPRVSESWKTVAYHIL